MPVRFSRMDRSGCEPPADQVRHASRLLRALGGARAAGAVMQLSVDHAWRINNEAATIPANRDRGVAGHGGAEGRFGHAQPRRRIRKSRLAARLLARETIALQQVSRAATGISSMIDLRVTEYDLPLSRWAAWSACRRAVPNSITAARSSSNPPQFSPRRTGPYLPVAKTCPHDSRAQAARSEYSSFPGTFDALGQRPTVRPSVSRRCSDVPGD